MSDKAESVIGIHAVTELLNKRPASVKQLLVQSDRNDQRLNSIRELAQREAITIVELNRKEMDQRYRGVHQGVAAIASSETRMRGRRPNRSEHQPHDGRNSNCVSA